MPRVRRTRSRRGFLIAVLTALIAMVGPLAAAPAHAVVEGVTCVLGSNNATYSPALTNQPQDVTLTVHVEFQTCVSPSEPALRSASGAATHSIEDRSCLELVGRNSGTGMLTWNTGQTTVYDSVSNATIAGAVYTVNVLFTVTDGLFKGHKGIANYTGPATDILLCTLGLGTVKKINTVGTLEILPL